MADTSRIENEKAFHNESFSTGLRSKIDSYYEIFVGIRAEFRRRVAESIRGENALELGCGPTTFSPEFAALAAHIKGIDISEEAVRQSEERAKAAEGCAVRSAEGRKTGKARQRRQGQATARPAPPWKTARL